MRPRQDIVGETAAPRGPAWRDAWTPRGADRSHRFPRQQARRIARDVALQVGLVLLLIECIFVSEKLISGLLEEVLKIQAPLSKTLVMMAALLPEVFELALPTAVLIAVYRVALAMREDREFLMLSSLGIPPHGLIRLVLVLGLGAQLATVFIGGFIDPLSRYAFRLVMFTAQYDALAGNTVSANRLFETRVGTVVVTPRAGGEGRPRLFVRQEDGPDRERVVVANGASLTGPSETGRVSLHLYDFSVDEFASPRAEVPRTGRPSTAPISSLRGSSTQQTLVINDVVPFDPRSRNVAELTTGELLFSAGTNDGHRLELGKRIGRSLLCLLAPLIAILALSFTTRFNQAFVLPLACAGLMATEIVGTVALGGLAAPGGPLGGSVLAMLAFLAVMAALLAYAMTRFAALRSSAIARPGLSRS
ncbi:putative permease YjgP/YjgQ family protein [bacterium YEK0313]|nr:putative permease YjgP/YjgQ family protein [bacterium YEK0313]